MDALKTIAASSLKAETPKFNIGDTIKVGVNIREGEKERVQMFEGTVIAKKGSGVAETFTVRRVSYGVGVERVFPIHSPNVVSVEIIRHGRVRRSNASRRNSRQYQSEYRSGQRFRQKLKLLFSVSCGCCPYDA